MRYIDLAYDATSRTLTVSDSLAGTTVDDLSTTFRIGSALTALDADIDVVYGVLLRRGAGPGYAFSRFEDGEAPIPQDVLKACRGGSLPIYLRITYDSDSTIESSQPLTLTVANLPDPVETAHASGDKVMLRFESWEYRPGMTYKKGSVAVYNNSLYISKDDLNRNHLPTDTTWWATITASGLPPSISTYLEGLEENIQDAIDEFRGDIQTHGESIDDLEEDVGDLTDTVTTLSGNVNTIGNSVNTLSNSVNTLSGNVTTMQTAIAGKATPGDVTAAREQMYSRVAQEERARTEADANTLRSARQDIAEALAEAKRYTDASGGTAYRYKGSTTNTGLTSIAEPGLGDIYNITDDGRFPAGSNVAWDGQDWDKLSETVDLTFVRDHIASRQNPHGVDWTQIGLSEAQVSAINSGADATVIGQMEETILQMRDYITYGSSPTSATKLWIYYQE